MAIKGILCLLLIVVADKGFADCYSRSDRCNVDDSFLRFIDLPKKDERQILSSILDRILPARKKAVNAENIRDAFQCALESSDAIVDDAGAHRKINESDINLMIKYGEISAKRLLCIMQKIGSEHPAFTVLETSFPEIWLSECQQALGAKQKKSLREVEEEYQRSLPPRRTQKSHKRHLVCP